MRAATSLALVLAGCYSPSPAVGIPCSPELTCPSGQMCDTSQSPPTCVAGLVDASIDSPDAFTGCVTSADCTASTKPVCDPSAHQCRGCRADAECGAICTEYDGQCSPESHGIYVSTTGDDASNNCSHGQPCKTFSRALTEVTTNRRIVVVLDGSYSATNQSVLNVNVTGDRIVISGEDQDPAGAFLTAVPGGTINPVVVNVGSGTDVVLEGLTIRNGQNDGIRNSGSLLVYRSAVTNNNGTGVASNTSDPLHIWESSITLNQKEGVNGQKGPVEILRTLIARNVQVGIFISQSATTLTNDIIVRNGATSTNGGIRLQNLNGAPQALSFLTIAYNTASNANIAGLSADQTVAISNSILVENNNASTGVDQICSGCTATFSLFSSTTIPIGMGNIGGAPAFVDIATDDFHLQSTSAANGVADSAATTRIDYDGDPRPSGAGFEMGADELP